jgi:hypothetical protein
LFKKEKHKQNDIDIRMKVRGWNLLIYFKESPRVDEEISLTTRSTSKASLFHPYWSGASTYTKYYLRMKKRH